MKCPYCAEEIKDEALKCKHCGEWLKPEKAVISNSRLSSSIKPQIILVEKEIGNLKYDCTEIFNDGFLIFLIVYFSTSVIGLLLYLLWSIIIIVFGSVTVAEFISNFGNMIKGCFVYFPVFVISCLLGGQLFFFIVFQGKTVKSRNTGRTLSTLNDQARIVEIIFNIIKLPVILIKLLYAYFRLYFLKHS